MDLESVIQSGVSQKEKISYINTYNMKSRKMVRTCSVMFDSFSPYGL